MDNNPQNRVLVIGAGVAGINASLKLAEAGCSVLLCEAKSSIGGMLYQMDKWFPDNHCGMCKTLPVVDERNGYNFCLRKGLFNSNIKVLLNSQVKRVDGEAGSFAVELSTRSAGVNPELCTGCGLCEQVCPADLKAIHSNSNTANNKYWIIDREHCTKCGLCVEKCPTGAINFEIPDEAQVVQVSSIIIATGFEEYDSRATAFGYKRYPNVLTGLELEGLLSQASSGGLLKRPSDGKIPQKIAFLQCIGSRNKDRGFCSAVCCMSALKEAILLKQNNPEADITIFFMDMRDFGKSYYRYYEQARQEYGIKFERCRVPVVNQNFTNHDLLISHFAENGKIETCRFNLVVLSVGQSPSGSFKELCASLGIETNKWGYCNSKEFSPVETNRPGIYICGTASGPKDIVDSLTESIVAAGRAIDNRKAVLSPETQKHFSQTQNEPQTVVYLCNCNNQLLPVLDMEKIKATVEKLPGVTKTIEVQALCQPETLKKALENCKENNAGALIMAGCSRLMSEKLAGHLVEVINIRENLAWVHTNERKAATDKVKTLIAMSLSRIQGRDTIKVPVTPFVRRALVIGGGLAGMTAARYIAQSGIEVEVVEKLDKLGGNFSKVHSLLENKNFPAYVQQLIEDTKLNKLIHVSLNTSLSRFSGYAGNYHYTLEKKDGALIENDAGAVVIASGAEEMRPEEYLYGTLDKIIIQTELEEGLNKKTISPEKLKSVAMIQCVGSRDSQRPYCSRVCCMKALKNALYLKQENPQIEVTVFYRDLMSYGLKEEYYTRAREQGILFVRYESEKKPLITKDESGIKIEALDLELGELITIRPDIVVLSSAIVPTNTDLSKLLGIELTQDGFIKEADVKFRPVETLKDGIYVCGLAHSPRDIKETIVQAQATAQRAIALLNADSIPLRNVSIVNERKCSGCGKCVKACPYHARVLDDERKIACVISRFCRACGICVAACPNGAAGLNEIASGQFFSMLDAAI